MKKQVVVALIAVLALGGAVQAASSRVDVTLGPLSPDGFVDVESHSYAYAYDGIGDNSQTVSGGTYLTNASMSFAGASAYAGTTYMSGEGPYLEAGAWADTSVGLSAGGYGRAYQDVFFEAVSDGIYSFTAPYSVDWTLDSAGPGGTAYFDAQVNMVLSVWYEFPTGFDWLELDAQTLSFDEFVEDGDTLDDGISSSITVSSEFFKGESGWIRLYVDGQVTTTAVPVPGAVVLGLLGTGLVGALRRRRAV